MADAVRNYFDAKVPIQPADYPTRLGSAQRPTWQQAWNQLSRQLFLVAPQQLDRARVYRNRFIRAVQ